MYQMKENRKLLKSSNVTPIFLGIVFLDSLRGTECDAENAFCARFVKSDWRLESWQAFFPYLDF